MNTYYLKSLILFGIIFLIACSKEDDLIIPTQDLETNTRQIQNLNFNNISRCMARDLKISIDPCLEQEWVDASYQAIQEFNDITNVGIQMSIVETGSDIDIVCGLFTCSTLFGPNLTAGYADPATMEVRLAPIQEIKKCCDKLDPNELECLYRRVVKHEIMHHLGFGHDGDSGDNFVHINGTLLNDPASIMTGGDACSIKCNFSENDTIALRALYPVCYELKDCTTPDRSLEINPLSNLYDDHCQIYHATANADNGSIVAYRWTLSPMDGVTIYDNSQNESTLKFSFDEEVIDGDDFVIRLRETVELCEFNYKESDTQIVHVFDCESDSGDGDQ